MDTAKPTPPSQSTVAKISLAGSAACAAIVFSSGVAMNGLENAIGILLFSCWAALPLLVLGLVRLFRQFPGTHAALLVLGISASVLAAAAPFGRGSTSAIGLVTIPFFLLLIYAAAGFVLICVKTYSE